MADVAVKEPPAQVKKARTFPFKKFEIVIHRAKNEPFLTLEYLHKFIGSLADTFTSSNDKVHNPNPAVLKIFAGTDAIISQNIKFDINGLKNEDFDIPGRGEQYIKNVLYPEDVIEIIFITRGWLANRYKKEVGEYSWKIEASVLQSYWNQARGRKNEDGLTGHSIADFSRRELLQAVEELFTQIDQIIQQKTKSIKYDSIDYLITEIKAEFIKEPVKTWEKIGLVLAKALVESSLSTPVVSIPDKNFSVTDVRLAINTIHEQIVDHLEKKDELKKPWDRVSEITKNRFGPRQKPYFKLSEEKEAETNTTDIVRTTTFIEWIKQLLIDLKKEPVKEEVVAEKEEETVEGGGEDSAEAQAHFIAPAEIISQATDAFTAKSSDAFSKYLSDSELDPNQQDWLLTRLTREIPKFIDRAAIEVRIRIWIPEKLTPKSGENNLYHVGAVQFNELSDLLDKEFFPNSWARFLEWVKTVPSVEKLEESQPVTPDTPAKTAVVPDAAELPEEEAGQKIGIESKEARERMARDLTTQFLVSRFGDEGEAIKQLRQLIHLEILNGLPANPTRAELEEFKRHVFNKLQLDPRIFDKAQQHYQKRISDLGIENFANIYNTIDSILVLSGDPRDYFSRLSDSDLLKHFGLEGSGVSVTELKKLILGLITIRQYAIAVNITPWFTDKESEDEKIPQALGGVRTFVKNYGKGGVAALNLDLEGINSSAVSDHNKAVIKQLYKELWLGFTTGKTQEEIMLIYEEHGVGIIQIDYNLPPPGFDSFSDLVQSANYANPDANQKQKSEIAKRLFSKIGEAGLLAVAPEVGVALEALKKIPGVGDFVDKKTGELGSAMVTFGAILGAGAVALVAFIGRSAGALIGGTIGGVFGGVIGSTLGTGGTIFGALTGTGIGGAFGNGVSFKGMGNFFKGLGGTGSSKVGVGGSGAFKLAKPITLHPAVIPSAAGVTLFAGYATTVISGTQLHPVNFNTTDPSGTASPYVKIVKDANPRYLDEPGAITYTINITAADDYSITITDVLDELKIRYNTDKYPGGVPTPSNTTKTIDDFPELANLTINAGETFSFTYTTDYTSDFQHANVVNYFTISFTYSSSSESGSAEAMSLASVKFGEAPIFDGCWPVESGSITQLPFDPFSHQNDTKTLGADAIDIGSVGIETTVYATFGGEAIWVKTRGNYGLAVIIDGADGKFIYAHLSAAAVTEGTQVAAGDVIGLTGNSGVGTGAHLHYERASNSGAFYSTSLGSASTLLQLHESPDLQEADTISRDSCN